RTTGRPAAFPVDRSNSVLRKGASIAAPGEIAGERDAQEREIAAALNRAAVRVGARTGCVISVGSAARPLRSVRGELTAADRAARGCRQRKCTAARRSARSVTRSPATQSRIGGKAGAGNHE